MRQNRRAFVKTLGAAALLADTGGLPVLARGKKHRLTILHTNDTHSHLEAFPENHPKYPGLGGVVARNEIIKQIRAENNAVLLVDSGDIFQGTPYFNFYNGEPEIKAMNLLGYDAATLGNHDFDAGMEHLKNQIIKARFPFICSNYDFNNTVLNNLTTPFHIINKGEIKIGIIGLGIELQGLVPDKLFGETQYNDPLSAANNTAQHLKEELGCHLIIALSHLGHQYNSDRICDLIIAEKSRNIDIILGGHTHTFMEKPVWKNNLENKKVLIHQVGWAGVLLGRIDVLFEKNLKKNYLSTDTVIVDKKSIAF